LATIKRLKADIPSVRPSSEQMKELWFALGLYGSSSGAMQLVGTWQSEKQ